MEQNEQEKQNRNLKSFAVKLPEEVIEEIEKLYSTSGLRFKNEFIEHLIQKHKVNLLKEGKHTEDILHPEIVKNTSSDVYELAKLTHMINELFIHQLEKFSVDRYESDRLRKQNEEFMSKNKLLESIVEKKEDPKSSSSSIQQHLQKMASSDLGHSLYIGTSGVGKSYAAKLEIKKAINAGKLVIVIDPQGEYKRLTEKLGGQHIKISSTNNNCINPLELHNVEAEHDENIFTQKILDVLTILESMLKRYFSARERKILLDAIETTYRKFGIDRNALIHGKQMPTLGDLEVTLRGFGSEGVSLADDLEPYTNGFLSLFNGTRNFSIIESPMIVFDIQDLEKGLSYTASLIVLDFIYGMIKNKVFENTLLIIDEGWMFIQEKGSSDYLSKVLKTAKKFHTDILLISQQPADMLRNAEFIFNLCETKVFFRQNLNDLNHLVERFDFLESERSFLKNLDVGKAFVHIGKEFSFFMTFEKDDIADTNPDVVCRVLY